MPTYVLDLEVPKSKPEDDPKELELEIREGVITRWFILIPAGHQTLARMRVLYGLEPLLPAHEDAWIKGECEVLDLNDWWDPPEEPYKLRFQGWNEDDTNPHTFYVRIVVLPREVALAHRLFLRRIGEEISEAFMRAAGYV